MEINSAATRGPVRILIAELDGKTRRAAWESRVGNLGAGAQGALRA